MDAARDLVRDEARELIVTRAAREAAGDEQRLVPALDPEPLELFDRSGDRLLPRIALRPGKRQRGRLDEDRRSSASARDERLERLAGEGKPQRVANRRAHVRDPTGRGRRPQRQRVVLGSHDDEPRSG